MRGRKPERLMLWLLERLIPSRDREWIVGDTLEELDRIEACLGRHASYRWLAGELWRVTLNMPRRWRTATRGDRLSPQRPKGGGAMVEIVNDLRYGLRLLARSPGFAIVAILTLAIGIGANTAMFAVVNAVLLKPLPFWGAERLMLVHLRVPDRQTPGMFGDLVWSYPKYQAFLTAQTAFEDIAIFDDRDITISGDSSPERVRGEVITETYLRVLGIEPTLGRSFSHAEANVPGNAPVALIGHGLWARRFAGDPAVVGRTVHVNAVPFTIVGVLPQGFSGLNGNAQIWVPLAALEPTQLRPDAFQSHAYMMVARRKPGLTEAAAIAATRVAGVRVDAAFPAGTGGPAWGASAVSLYNSRADVDVRRGSLLLLGSVGCVLLIACVNLTNLVASRTGTRARELAVRIAVGASRFRIIRQLTVEGALLSGIGTATGLLLARLLLETAGALLPEADVFLQTAMTPGTPRIAGAAGLTRIGAGMIGLDTVTLGFACVLAIVTTMLVSLMPAWRVSALQPGIRLASLRGANGASDVPGTRSVLMAAQIALALVLLTGAGLMLRSAARLSAIDIGVSSDRILTMRLDLPTARYNVTTAQTFSQQLLTRVSAMPGVQSAAFGSCAPVSGGCSDSIVWYPPAAPLGGGRDPGVGVYWVSPGFLSTLGVGLHAGRTFTDRDRAGQPRVVLVSERAARRLWPNDSPLGKRIAVGQGGFGAGAEIVGVVGDVRYDTIDAPPTPAVYIPLAQSFQPRMRLFVRSDLASEAVVAGVARTLRDLDASLALGEIKTLEQRVDDAMWRTRVGAWLLSAFAALALLLTSIGIVGVMAQAVAQRTSEIGIRVALGARQHDILSLVVGRAVYATGAGLVVGILGVVGLSSATAGLLHDVDPHDPGTLAASAALLAAVALLASYLPARRAARVEAVVALRAE